MSESGKPELMLEDAIELRKRMNNISEDIKVERIKLVLDPIIKEIKNKLAYDTESNRFVFTVELPKSYEHPDTENFRKYISGMFPDHALYYVRVENGNLMADGTAKFDVILQIK